MPDVLNMTGKCLSHFEHAWYLQVTALQHFQGVSCECHIDCLHITQPAGPCKQTPVGEHQRAQRQRLQRGQFELSLVGVHSRVVLQVYIVTQCKE